jgi:hypothetical protein
MADTPELDPPSFHGVELKVQRAEQLHRQVCEEFGLLAEEVFRYRVEVSSDANIQTPV